ncbi:MAG: hypothetical protein WBD06_02715, partial [Acidobacteriaceae bacterium]
ERTLHSVREHTPARIAGDVPPNQHVGLTLLWPATCLLHLYPGATRSLIARLQPQTNYAFSREES